MIFATYIHGIKSYPAEGKFFGYTDNDKHTLGAGCFPEWMDD